MYIPLPFITISVGDLFKYKIDDIFIELTNVFGIANDILIVGYDADG